MGEEFTVELRANSELPGGVASRELAEFLEREVTEFSVAAKVEEDRQDAGTIFEIVLGSSAILALANGVAKWVELRRRATVTLRVGDSELEIKNVTSKDAEQIAAKILDASQGRRRLE